MADKTTRKRKRGKHYYVGHKNKRVRNVLEAGMMGVLITCNHREKDCTREGYNILNEYADELYGPEKFSNNDKEDDQSSSEEDVESALAKEVEEIKSKTSDRRFQAVDSGAKNVIFIKSVLPDGVYPCTFVHHIMADLFKTKSKKARHCQRLLPVNGSCKANTEEIKELAEEMFKPFFHSQESEALKFCISYKARNNQSLNRDEVISTLAAVIRKGGEGHSVDLNHPDLTVIVEIIKNVCCMAVVKDFFTFKKYNLHSIIEESFTKGKDYKDNAQSNGTVNIDMDNKSPETLNLTADNEIERKTKDKEQDENRTVSISEEMNKLVAEETKEPGACNTEKDLNHGIIVTQTNDHVSDHVNEDQSERV